MNKYRIKQIIKTKLEQKAFKNAPNRINLIVAIDNAIISIKQLAKDKTYSGLRTRLDDISYLLVSKYIFSHLDKIANDINSAYGENDIYRAVKNLQDKIETQNMRLSDIVSELKNIKKLM